MLTTDYELVFPHRWDVDGYYVKAPNGVLCDGYSVLNLVNDFYRDERYLFTANDDINVYRESVKNQDENTVKELERRRDAFKDEFTNVAADLIAHIICVARVHDVSGKDIQLGIDKLSGLSL